MLNGSETPEELGRNVLALMQSIADNIPYDRLAEDMGFNNQPVTTDEILGLQDFLARATDTSK